MRTKRRERRGTIAMMLIGNDNDNFYEMKTSKLAMPGLIAPACFPVVEGDEGLLLVLGAQADDAHLFHCCLLFKV